MRSAVLLFVTGAFPLVMACSPGSTPPAATIYKPVISLNEMMISVVDANSHIVWDIEEAPPDTADDWNRLEHAAVTLAASGNLTMMSGNGPEDQQWTEQADWMKYSTAVSDAGLAAMQAVRARDIEAVKKSGDQLVMTCINCHREYKLDVPKIWSDHEGHK
jgi:hypothetical protein